jgi:urease accessory protein
MLTITSIVGNVSSNAAFADAYGRLSALGEVETILLSRPEAQRSRMRRHSDAGTDIAITLEDGHHLRHGDVLLADDNRMIVVHYEPEDVLRFRMKDGLPDGEKIAVAVKLGHLIGNLHRPICTKDDAVYMPLQSDVEVESIVKAMGPMISWIEVQHVKTVFEPQEGSSLHTH